MRRFLFALVASFGSLTLSAQDIHFSQFNETPMHLNPANTGLFDGLFRISGHYRSQWASLGNPYKTMATSFDMPLAYKKNGAYMGIGIFAYSDKAGDSNFGTKQGSVSVSGIVPISSTAKFSAGIQAGFGQRSATTSSLQWENQYINGSYDPSAPSNESNILTSFLYADLSGGIAAQFRNANGTFTGKNVRELNIGLSAFHFNKPQQRFHGGGGERLYMRIVANANYRFDVPDSKWSIRPGGYFMNQGPTNEILIGSMFRYRMQNGTKITNFNTETGVAFGASYRYKDAIIPQVYFDLGDIFIGLSYDLNVSTYKVASKSQGGMEITLRYANLNGALYKNKK
jgi:type IX secretion system PorP/SprF family membrane protein